MSVDELPTSRLRHRQAPAATDLALTATDSMTPSPSHPRHPVLIGKSTYTSAATTTIAPPIVYAKHDRPRQARSTSILRPARHAGNRSTYPFNHRPRKQSSPSSLTTAISQSVRRRPRGSSAFRIDSRSTPPTGSSLVSLNGGLFRHRFKCSIVEHSSWNKCFPEKLLFSQSGQHSFDDRVFLG